MPPPKHNLPNLPTETISGTVTRLLFSSGDFRILQIRAAGHPQRQVVLGDWPSVRVGARITALGHWEKNKKRQDELQFRATEIHEDIPDDTEGLAQWLGSGAVKGIGPTTAQKIVARFGKDTLDILDHHPERLSELGIRGKRQEKIREAWQAASAQRQIMQFLREVGLGAVRSSAVWKTFADHPKVHGDPARLITLLRKDPWRLCEVRGIGFSQADLAAGRMGIAATDPLRLAAGLLQVLRDREGEGHIWTTRQTLFENALALLGVENVDLSTSLQSLLEQQEVVPSPSPQGVLLALRDSAETEQSLAREIRRLLGAAPAIPVHFPEGFTPHPAQTKALDILLRQRFGILSGGPGMGKTTLVRTMVQSARKAGFTVLLCAPTGRAAQRMEEATGASAQTIHRFLGGLERGGFPSQPNRTLLVIDETSMLDQALALWLFRSLPTGVRVILVGDPDQLPSVGPGQVLADLLETHTIPKARLTHIFRQAAGSVIPVLASQVLAGETPNLSQLVNDNLTYHCVDEIKDATPEQATAWAVDQILAASRVWGHRVQVLSPMRKGALGTMALNTALREAFNPDHGQPSFGRFRVGDVVLHTRNNYDLQVFNGELGTITAIHRGPCETYRGARNDSCEDAGQDDTLLDPSAMLEANGTDPHLHVQFEDREVIYTDSEDWEDLAPAWCLTVHKSQGGQFPAVCLVATTSHYVMLRRNLIYTGITRAEKHLLFLTHPKALRQVSRSRTQDRRLTCLSARLQGDNPVDPWDQLDPSLSISGSESDTGHNPPSFSEQELFGSSASDVPFLDLPRVPRKEHQQPLPDSPEFDPFADPGTYPTTQGEIVDSGPVSARSMPAHQTAATPAKKPSSPARTSDHPLLDLLEAPQPRSQTLPFDRPSHRARSTSRKRASSPAAPKKPAQGQTNESDTDWSEFLDWVSGEV